jgi:hypothetical protein
LKISEDYGGMSDFNDGFNLGLLYALDDIISVIHNLSIKKIVSLVEKISNLSKKLCSIIEVTS